jgi:ABC-2 type transport system permease protein
MLNNLLPLMQREWLQHRLAWALLVLIPLGLAVLPLTLGQIDLSGICREHSWRRTGRDAGHDRLVATTAVIFLLVWITRCSSPAAWPGATTPTARWSSGSRCPRATPRAWPPLLVHLVLVPAAALLAGLAGVGCCCPC